MLWRSSLDLLRPYWRACAIVLGAIVVETAYWTLVPLALQHIIDIAIPAHDVTQLGGTLLVLCVGFTAMAAVSIRRAAITAGVGARLLADRRLQLFEHVQRLPPRFFADTRTGDVAGRFLTELNAIEQALTIGLPEVVWGALVVAVNVPLLYVLNVPLAVVASVAVPLALIGPRILAPRVAASAYLRRQSEGRLLASLHEQVAGRAVVRAFGLESLMRDRLRLQFLGLRDVTAREGFQSRLVGRSTTLGSSSGQLLVYASGSVLVFAGFLSLGAFIGFVGLLLNISSGIHWLAFGLPIWLQAAGPLARIEEILAEPTETADPSDAAAVTHVSGEIQLRNVTFAYTAGDPPRISNLSLDIPAGARVAVVGPSGSGKSTLLNLLLRTYDPDAGAVLLDGRDIRSVSRASLRQHIGVVFQDTFLFAGSVRDNIRLGKPDASNGEVERAAEAARLHEAIADLRDGYDTQVGERGEALSGGQRQRVALARALVRDPAILLLDEATSALDPRTEAEFNAALSQIGRTCTIVTVTHRLGGAIAADRIFVIADGRLVEQGTHGDLVMQDGAYAGLWAMQASISVADDGMSAEVSPRRLRLIPLLSALDDTLLERLAQYFVPESVGRGRDIVTQGDPGDRFYVLARGSADVVQTDANGSERWLRTLVDGDHFGELALLRKEPRSATVRARTACLVLSLASQHFERLLEADPGMRETIQYVRT
jgi:ATP-binding cassette subfamily B protein